MSLNIGKTYINPLPDETRYDIIYFGFCNENYMFTHFENRH